MSRIRSIHPGTFTDDEFMGLPALAKVLLFGIWTEADDQGVFAWKPRTLRARILPNDECNIEELLASLTAGRFIQQFEHSGNSWGAVRNFRKFQRPQKPTAINPLPEELRSYVCLDATTTVPLPEPSLTPPVKPPQMEDGIGKKKKEESKRVVADAPRPSKPDPKGTRLEPDWRPSAEDWAYCIAQGRDPDATLEDFLDHWLAKPGSGGRKLNWPRTWRKWCRSDIGKRPSGGGRGHGKSEPQGVLAAAAALQARYRSQPGFQSEGLSPDRASAGGNFGRGQEFSDAVIVEVTPGIRSDGGHPVPDGDKFAGPGGDGNIGAVGYPDRGSDGIPPGHRKNSSQEMGSAGNVVALPSGDSSRVSVAHEEPASTGGSGPIIPEFLRRN